MTTKEIQKRNGKAQGLSAFRVSEHEFLVESSEGKICYKVRCSDDEISCPCGDFARNSKTDPNFRCKHIMAVLDCGGNVPQVEALEKRKAKLDDRFIKNIQGRDFVIYSGLLDLAHQKGLIKLGVEIVQYPTKDNNYEAICKAVAETKSGDIFCDIGDANSKNTNQMISHHLIRMASTRAKARALRDLTNIGMTCLEELGDINDVLGEGENKSNGKDKKIEAKKAEPVVKPIKPEPQKKAAEEPKKETEKPKEVPIPAKNEPTDKTAPKMSEAQKKAMYNLGRRRGISTQELDEMVKNSFSTNVEDLTSQQASSFIRQLQSAA